MAVLYTWKKRILIHSWFEFDKEAVKALRKLPSDESKYNDDRSFSFLRLAIQTQKTAPAPIANPWMLMFPA